MSPRSLRNTILTGLLASAAVLTACADDHPETTTPPPSIQAQVSRAELQEVAQEIEVQGIVEARQVAAISARVMAMVTAVHANAGDQVERGQLLIEIDPQAAKGQLSQAQGALSQARAALALAERNHERFKALAAERAASDLEVDMARMQHEQAVGAVEQAEGAVAAASSVAADTRVTAPFNGRIARKMVEVGDLAAPGRPLMMVESIAGRRLALSIPESLAQQTSLDIGSPLPVQIDSRPDLGRLEATVVERAPGADPASHSIQVKLDLPMADLTTGAAGRAWIATGTRRAVAVPSDAILQQGGLTLVVILTDDGTAASRVVTVGRELAEGQVEILSGLTGEETVLVGLAATPPAGARVEARS